MGVLSFVLVVLGLVAATAGLTFVGLSLREMGREGRRPDMAKVNEDIKQMSRRERRAAGKAARSGERIADPDEAHRAEALARFLWLAVAGRTKRGALFLIGGLLALLILRWLRAGEVDLGGTALGLAIFGTLFALPLLYVARLSGQLKRTAEANGWDFISPSEDG